MIAIDRIRLIDCLPTQREIKNVAAEKFRGGVLSIRSYELEMICCLIFRKISADNSVINHDERL